SQTSWPFSFTMILGARSCSFDGRRPSNMSRGSTRWSSTEITVYFTSSGSGSGRNSVESSIWVMTRAYRSACLHAQERQGPTERSRRGSGAPVALAVAGDALAGEGLGGAAGRNAVGVGAREHGVGRCLDLLGAVDRALTRIPTVAALLGEVDDAARVHDEVG